MIVVTFTCGHRQTVSPSATGALSCLTCGTSRVSRVKAPPPRFTGVVTGPCARTVDLGPVTVNLAEPDAPALKLKPQGDVHG